MASTLFKILRTNGTIVNKANGMYRLFGVGSWLRWLLPLGIVNHYSQDSARNWELACWYSVVNTRVSLGSSLGVGRIPGLYPVLARVEC